MRSFVLSLCVALLSVAGLAHAKATSAADLRKLVLAGTATQVKTSFSPNSTYAQVNAAIDGSPSAMRKVMLTKATTPDNGSSFYLLKNPIPAKAAAPGKLVKANVAYIISESIGGPRMSKVVLQGN
jgi:hypothetical protein